MAGDPVSGWAEPATEALAAMSVGVLVVDAEGVVEFANPEAARLLGRELGTLPGTDARAVFAPGGPHPAASTAAALEPATSGAPAAEDTDVFARADGSLVPVSWVADPVGDPDPQAGGRRRVVVTFADITQRQLQAVTEAASQEQNRAELWTARQSISDLGWIAELTRVMSSTLDEAEALRRLARLTVPRLADISVIDVIDDAGELHRRGAVAAPGVDLDLDAVLTRPDVQHDPVLSRQTRAVIDALVVTRLSAVQIADPAVLSAPSRVLLVELGARSVLVVPLAARNRTVGVLGLLRFADDAYTDDDMLLAADIGRRAGLVLDNARLYRRQQDNAEQLQRALLPAVHGSDHLQLAARYLPAADRLRVGGDWYDTFADPGDPSSHVLVIGDVAGHDLGAATAMAATRNLLRGIAVSGTDGPAGVLRTVDVALPALDVRTTATVLFVRARRDDDGWDVTWSNAGHPPAVLALPDGEVTFLGDSPDPLLGTMLGPPRRDHRQRIPFGSVLVLYTDGLVERRGEDINRGLHRVQEAVSEALRAGRDVGADGDTDGDTDVLTDQILARAEPSPDDDTAILVARLG